MTSPLYNSRPPRAIARSVFRLSNVIPRRLLAMLSCIFSVCIVRTLLWCNGFRSPRHYAYRLLVRIFVYFHTCIKKMDMLEKMNLWGMNFDNLRFTLML